MPGIWLRDGAEEPSQQARSACDAFRCSPEHDKRRWRRDRLKQHFQHSSELASNLMGAFRTQITHLQVTFSMPHVGRPVQLAMLLHPDVAFGRAVTFDVYLGSHIDAMARKRGSSQ